MGIRVTAVAVGAAVVLALGSLGLSQAGAYTALQKPSTPDTPTRTGTRQAAGVGLPAGAAPAPATAAASAPALDCATAAVAVAVHPDGTLGPAVNGDGYGRLGTYPDGPHKLF